jgi:hypothetical protein
MYRPAFAASLLSSALLLALPASAQQSPVGQDGDQPAAEPGEVVVTATRRAASARSARTRGSKARSDCSSTASTVRAAASV